MKKRNFLKFRGCPEMVLSLRRSGVIRNLKKYREKFFCRKNKGRKKRVMECDDSF
jgi:hypothetical protein